MPRFAVAFLFLAVSLVSAMAAPPERAAPGAVIDEVARYTGLTNDAVSLALKDNAAALGRLTDAVLALQIAQRFLDARDADLAADVFAAATDTAAEALLPPPLMTAIKAMRVYKSMLEAARARSSSRRSIASFTPAIARSAIKTRTGLTLSRTQRARA